METRHIRIDYNEALESKKELLTSELNLLYSLKRLKAYKFLRRKEMIAKIKLKSQISSLKQRFKLLESTFPDQKDLHVPDIKKKLKLSFEDRETKNIEEELMQIKLKLEKLQ